MEHERKTSDCEKLPNQYSKARISVDGFGIPLHWNTDRKLPFAMKLRFLLAANELSFCDFGECDRILLSLFHRFSISFPDSSIRIVNFLSQRRYLLNLLFEEMRVRLRRILIRLTTLKVQRF